MDNEVMQLIDDLYSMVSEAWGVPLGNDKCIVERDKVLSVIEDIKNRIPSELAEAKRLVSARDEFIGNAKREAESIRRAAEEKARAMVDEQEVVRVARAKAAEIESTAGSRATALRQAAMEFIDDALRRAEESASAALGELHSSRARFRGAAGVNEHLRAAQSERQPQAAGKAQEEEAE